MRYRNPKFKKSIRDELSDKPQKSHEEKRIKITKDNFIATPSKESIRRLWWSKYSPDLKNPQTKSSEASSESKKDSESDSQ